jgi:Flp pilus assembly secretin CpaC
MIGINVNIAIRRLATVLLLWPSYADAQTDISLSIGERKIIALPDIAQSVTVDKSGVVDVNRGETKSIVVIKAKSAGQVEVKVAMENGKNLDYRVSVSESKTSSQGEAMARLSKISGLVIEGKGSQVYIKGNILNKGDLQTLAAIKADFPGVIVDTTKGELYEGSTVVRTINRILSENDIANMQAHAYGNSIVLEGSAKDEKQLALALKIARSIHPAIEEAVSKDSNGAPSIAIEVMFVEVHKSSSTEAGIGGLVDAFGGNPKGGPTGALNATMDPIGGHETRGRASLNWQVGPLSAFIKLIQSRGGSRLLSNPRLVTRSGHEAMFQSGGVFYLQSERRASSGDDVQGEIIPVNYGIELKILPRLDAIGLIDSKVATSVSEIAEVVNGMPSVTKSSVDTAVTIRNGQSLLLSGLVRKRDDKSIKRVPLLADIPLIGEFFKTRELRGEEAELLVLVTMRRVSATEERSGSTSQLFERSASDVEFSIFD